MKTLISSGTVALLLGFACIGFSATSIPIGPVVVADTSPAAGVDQWVDFMHQWEKRNNVEEEIELLRSDRPLERARAAARLSELADRREDTGSIRDALDDLVRLLSDHSRVLSSDVHPLRCAAYETTVAAEAARAIAHIKPTPVTRLSELLQQPASDFALAHTIDAIRAARCIELVPQITPLLDHDAAQVRVAAGKALSFIAPRKSATLLLARIRRETEVLAELLLSFSDVDLHETAAEIVRLLGSAEPEIRSQAAQAAGTIAYTKLPHQYHRTVSPSLAKVLADDSSPSVRRQAAAALGHTYTPDGPALEALLAALASDPSSDVRACCAIALSSRGLGSCERRAEALLLALDDLADRVRSYAIQSLKIMVESREITETEPTGTSERLQEAVLDALADGDTLVGGWAGAILVRLPPPGLNDRLFDLLAARKSVVPVVGTLSRTAGEDPRLIPALDATAMDTSLSDIDRGAAAMLLGQIFELSALPYTYREAAGWWQKHREQHLDALAGPEHGYAEQTDSPN